VVLSPRGVGGGASNCLQYGEGGMEKGIKLNRGEAGVLQTMQKDRVEKKT